MQHRSLMELEAGLKNITEAPADGGVLLMIVRRPEVDRREVLEEGLLDLEEGLVGDGWVRRRGSTDPDLHFSRQLTFVNSRVIDSLAGDRERWALAGDQLFVDLDLSKANLPAGTRLSVGEAIVEVSESPHSGCQKFSARYGLDALRFVNSPQGRDLRLRGMYAWVLTPGLVRVGDRVEKQHVLAGLSNE